MLRIHLPVLPGSHLSPSAASCCFSDINTSFWLLCLFVQSAMQTELLKPLEHLAPALQAQLFHKPHIHCLGARTVVSSSHTPAKCLELTKKIFAYFGPWLVPGTVKIFSFCFSGGHWLLPPAVLKTLLLQSCLLDFFVQGGTFPAYLVCRLLKESWRLLSLRPHHKKATDEVKFHSRMWSIWRQPVTIPSRSFPEDPRVGNANLNVALNNAQSALPV